MTNIPVRQIKKQYPLISPLDEDNELISILSEACSSCKSFEEVKSLAKQLMTDDIKVDLGWDNKGNKKIQTAALYQPFRNRLDFFSNQTCLNLNILPTIKTKPFTLKRDPDIADCRTAILLLFPNQNIAYLENNIKVIHRAVNTLWDRINQTRPTKRQSMLYLQSTEGHTGKTVFVNMLLEWARQRGLEVKENERVPSNQFISDSFSNKAIVVLNDLKEEEVREWAAMNNVIDGYTYVSEHKYKDAITLPAQAFILATSNFIPRDNNNRRIKESLFYMGSDPISDLVQAKVFKLDENNRADIDYYIPIIDKLLISCPYIKTDAFEYDNTFKEFLPPHNDVNKFIDSLEEEYLWILKAICKLYTTVCTQHTSNIITVATLTNKLNRNKEELEIDNSIRFTCRQVYHIVRELVRRGLLTKPDDARGSYDIPYDITPIIEKADEILSDSGSTYKFSTLYTSGNTSYQKTKDCYTTMINNYARKNGCSDWVSQIFHFGGEA